MFSTPLEARVKNRKAPIPAMLVPTNPPAPSKTACICAAEIISSPSDE
jgi:hypothetical protein